MTTSTLPASTGRATTPNAKRGRRSAVAYGLGVALIAALYLVCGWLLAYHLNAAIGQRAAVYAIVFAFLPVVPLLAGFYWLTALRPEPAHLLAVCVLWGALVAAYLALQLNAWLALQVGDRYGASPRSAVFVGPWVEEACKASILFAIAWWRRHNLNGMTAGVAYGAFAGIGFAFTENIVYYGQLFQQVVRHGGDNPAALDAVQHLFLWRGVAAPFVHPMFTMLTGIGIGLAVRHRHLGVRILAPAVGYCAAVLLHMSYNAAASFAAGQQLVAAYVGLLVPILLALVALVVVLVRYERRVIAARLHDYTVYGWLKQGQIPYLVDRRERRRLRRSAKPLSKSERNRVRELQRAGIDLGVLRDRVVRGVVSDTELAREAQLITAVRDLITRVQLPTPARTEFELVTAESSW